MLLILFLQLVINEVMNYPNDEVCGEFVEIYNNSNGTIYLNGFKITDKEDVDNIIQVQNPPPYITSRLFILPNEYTIIIDRDYFSNCTLNYNLFGNVLTTDDASIGNGLAKDDSIYIINANGDTTLRFEKPILNVPKDYSVERINFNIDEWGISVSLNGTPNAQNSIFSSSLIKVDSIYMVLEDLKINIKNLSNTNYEDNVKVVSGDTFNFQVSIPANSSYEIQISINLLKSPKIEILAQNFYNFFYIPIYYPALIINEIEYDNNPEWFEIYNATSVEIELSKFRIKDLSGNEFRLIGKIEPNGFKVFRADSFSDFISLNDNYESLVLISDFSFLFDYGGESISTLEKINPSLKGYLKDSWKSSLIEYGTPNKTNSVYVSDSALNLEIYISNKRVKKGEVLTISAYLNYSDDVEVYLFDDIGRIISKVYSVRNTNRIVFSLKTDNLKNGIYILLFKGSKFNKKAYFRVVE